MNAAKLNERFEADKRAKKWYQQISVHSQEIRANRISELQAFFDQKSSSYNMKMQELVTKSSLSQEPVKAHSIPQQIDYKSM